VITLLGRTAVSGGGVRTGVEVHASQAIGLLAAQDFGLDLSGGYTRATSRTTAAVLIGIGPVRANLGLGLVAAVPLGDRGATLVAPTPAFDIWGRW